MAEQYAHTLIAIPKDFVPSAPQIQMFLSTMVNQGIVPRLEACVVRTPSNRTREVRNPFTGKSDILKPKNHKVIGSLTEITSAIEGLPNFEIAVAGAGRPRIPPIHIDFSDPYHVSVTCFISSVLCCTSDPHSESSGGGEYGRYGEPCLARATRGLFCDPHNGEVIRVESAGCARFWIEFEPGKFLFPQLKNGDLQILNPSIVRQAEEAFGISFVQGCFWS